MQVIFRPMQFLCILLERCVQCCKQEALQKRVPAPGLSQYEFPHNLYLSLSFIPRVVAVALYIPALGFSEVSQKYVY